MLIESQKERIFLEVLGCKLSRDELGRKIYWTQKFDKDGRSRGFTDRQLRSVDDTLRIVRDLGFGCEIKVDRNQLRVEVKNERIVVKLADCTGIVDLQWTELLSSLIWVALLEWFDRRDV